MEREVEWALQTGRMQAELAALRERALRVAALLREMEWGCDHCPRCPICHRPDMGEGHAPTCRLAAELAGD